MDFYCHDFCWLKLVFQMCFLFRISSFFIVFNRFVYLNSTSFCLCLFVFNVFLMFVVSICASLFCCLFGFVC